MNSKLIEESKRAVEHSEYLAKSAESLLKYLNDMSDVEEGTIKPDEHFADFTGSLRGYVYEFRKRADKFKALASHPVSEPVGRVDDGWKPLTDYGQIKVGDSVTFYVGGKGELTETVKDVLNAGLDTEEIIYDTKNNYYFITSLALGGKSNHKNIRFKDGVHAKPLPSSDSFYRDIKAAVALLSIQIAGEQPDYKESAIGEALALLQNVLDSHRLNLNGESKHAIEQHLFEDAKAAGFYVQKSYIGIESPDDGFAIECGNQLTKFAELTRARVMAEVLAWQESVKPYAWFDPNIQPDVVGPLVDGLQINITAATTPNAWGAMTAPLYTSPIAQIPQGWKLVPIEPTHEE